MKTNKKNHEDCPFCKPPKEHKCPWCDPNNPRRDPWRESQCVLNKPLMMVIPPEGVHLSCPVHPEGHHVFGPAVHWMKEPTLWKETPARWQHDMTYRPIGPTFDHDPSKDLTFDSTRPFGTCTGDNIR